MEFDSKVRENEALGEKYRKVMILADSLLERHNRLIDHLELSMNQTAGLQQQVDSLKEKVTKLEDFKSQNIETLKRVKQLEAELEDSKSQNIETLKRVKQLEAELKELKDDFTEYKAVGRLRRSSREYIKITSDAILKGFAKSQGKKTVTWRYVKSRCKIQAGF